MNRVLRTAILLILPGTVFVFLPTGCETGESVIPDPVPGAAGLSCWDLNENGIGDFDEDKNDDGNFDAFDCQGVQGEQGPQGNTGSPGQSAAIVVSSIAELVAALADLPPQGGHIIVRAGMYVVVSTIVINRDNVIVEGQGTATFFRLADGANCPVFVIGEPTPFQPALTRRNIVLRNMRVSGNRTNQSSELCGVPGREFLRNNCVTVRQVEDCTVENVVLEGARSGGVVLEQVCVNVLLRRIITSDNHFDGIAWDGLISNCTISECTTRDNLEAGISFDIGPESNLIVNSIIVENGTVGIFMRDSRRNLFANCLIAKNGEDGVFIADGDAAGAAATENIFEANFYVDNVRNGIWQAGANSITNIVDGGFFCGNGANTIEESFPTAPLIASDITECP